MTNEARHETIADLVVAVWVILGVWGLAYALHVMESTWLFIPIVITFVGGFGLSGVVWHTAVRAYLERREQKIDAVRRKLQDAQ
jgi:uncharacterized ion transporter superfamily protein YfcC